ncbi:hypothetical protein [Morganella morganii IS15]|nr:hypothetical protein CSB69_2349 [Morganella morganii]EMP50504.1 hypothetical protein C790_02384 [Morganella morganii SC01]CDK64862.1 hypothetical protein [Morganella morganii IS15]
MIFISIFRFRKLILLLTDIYITHLMDTLTVCLHLFPAAGSDKL